MSSAQQIQAALRRNRELAQNASSTELVAASQHHGLQLHEEVPVNWYDIMRILEDALAVVTSEGGLASKRIADAIEIVEPALAVLADSAYAAQRRLDMSHVAWFDLFLVFLPGQTGNRARNIMAMQRRDREELKRLNELNAKVKELREQISKAVNGAMHRQLLSTDEYYRKLLDMRSKCRADSELLATLLDEMRLEYRIEVDEALRTEYARFQCTPKIQNWKEITWSKFGHTILMELDRVVADLRSQTEDAEQRMQALCDKHKRRLYGHQ